MTKRLEPDSFAPLAAHLEPIRHLAQAHQVARLEVFGSTVTGHAHECSDVDLLVVFKPLEASEHAQHYFGLKHELEGLLQRQVDLIELKSLENPYFLRLIEPERRLLYAA
ncbi:MAG: nucleotidyltransferase domain-containing protein [Deinococcota bacterium]|jgi:predicted nucleotidyltransferase|nr:nucleotidyltransferase domain-containing protein [Deinococcota bacterium]